MLTQYAASTLTVKWQQANASCGCYHKQKGKVVAPVTTTTARLKQIVMWFSLLLLWLLNGDNKLHACYTIRALLAFTLLMLPYLFLTSSGRDSEVLDGMVYSQLNVDDKRDKIALKSVKTMFKPAVGDYSAAPQ